MSATAARVSVVKEIEVLEVTLGSQFRAGDTAAFEADSRALAVQRQIETFHGKEGDRLLKTHETFTAPIALPPPDERPVEMRIRNRSPRIAVERIRTESVSSSSMLHVGSVRALKLESRTLNIRHLIPGVDPVVEVVVE